MKDGDNHPQAAGNIDIGSLGEDRPETLSILNMLCDREGKAKSENHQELLEEDSKRVLVSVVRWCQHASVRLLQSGRNWSRSWTR